MEPVNLLSDTQTRPTPEMRRAMASAEVGDEQSFSDPTVNRLCERVAELLGFEAAVYLPSGTMCNEIAIRLHIRPGGDEHLLHHTGHPRRFEAGGPAVLSGAVVHPLDGPNGMFDAATLAAAIDVSGYRYSPRSRLVSVEQTTNIAGGHVWPLDQVRGVVDVAKSNGLRLHLDGARLWNAHVAAGVPLDAYGRLFDTVSVGLSKGLGAPVGSLVVGSADRIADARWWRKRLGGGMRQVGILAAAGLHALDHHVDRLADDHARAASLARRLAEAAPRVVDPATVQTNIVVLDLAPTALAGAQLAAKARAEGVLVSVLGPRAARLVTHLDVDDAGCARAADVLARLLG
jgi:threonine aldolase